MISRAANPSDSAAIPERDRQEREADFDRVVVQHPLHLQRAQEEHPEQPGDEQHLDHVGERHLSGCGRSRSGISGLAAVRLAQR